MTCKISQDELKSMCLYSPDTGLFSLKHIKEIHAGKSTYLYARINGQQITLHRLAFLYMSGYMPEQIDHINGDGQDNRWCNIRSVTKSENMKNRHINCNNRSGFTGVYWVNHLSKWQAAIKNNNKKIYLGSYESIIDAVSARIRANKEYGFHENHGRKRINNKPERAIKNERS